MAKEPDAPPPSAEGELTARAPEGFGVRVKLATYSLDYTSEAGAPKARGFEKILGITLEHIDYLEGAIYTGIQLVPRQRSPRQPAVGNQVHHRHPRPRARREE
jgi:hypothetical protein